jgi:hypothetical protein
MNKSLWLVCLALFGLGAVVGRELPVPADARLDDARAIRKHIDRIFRAYIDEDRKTIRATHGEQWRGFLGRSRSIIRGIDEYMQAADTSLKSPGKMVGYEMLEDDVLFYGDMALVPYVAAMDVEVGGNRLGLRPKLRVLDVYAKQDGEWIQVASNTARHPDTEAALRQLPSPVTPALREQILTDRENVWRAWFVNDKERLELLIPNETVAINAGEEQWGHKEDILASSADFVEKGGKLVDLQFPRTEIQLYGDVAILYTTYSMTTEVDGQVQTASGRATEIFVRRGGRWVNPGWHLDSES